MVIAMAETDQDNMTFSKTEHLKTRQRWVYSIAVVLAFGAAVYCAVVAVLSEDHDTIAYVGLALALFALAIALTAHIDNIILSGHNHKEIREKLDEVLTLSRDSKPELSGCAADQSHDNGCMNILSEEKGMYFRLGSKSRWFRKSK